MKVNFDEADALKLLANGDKRGFNLLYKHYAPGIAHAAFSLVRDKDLTEDILQDVFYKVWLDKEKWAKVDNFKSYLFIAVRNSIVDHHKKKSKENLAKAEYILHKKLIEKSKADDHVLEKELTEFIETAINELPPQCKKVFMLFRDRGSQKEVAAELNLEQRTVKEYIYKARVHLRKRLKDDVVVSAYIGLCFLMS